MSHCHGCARCYRDTRREAMLVLAWFCSVSGGMARTLAHWALMRIGRGEAVGMG
jgi:hypothetical protein